MASTSTMLGFLVILLVVVVIVGCRMLARVIRDINRHDRDTVRRDR